MSTKTDKLKLSDTEQFSDLASRLQSQVDDQTVLAEIHVAIKELLSNNRATEARILEILQRRFDSGDLRPETFELVHKMLDRIRSETVTPAGDGTKTLVLDREPSGQDDPAYAKTLVIGNDVPAESLNDEVSFVNTEVIGDEVAPEKMMDNKQLQVGSILRDRFLLQQQVLGSGTGVVFKALDQRLAEAEDENTLVAIKILPSEISRNDKALRALQQEVAKGRCLNHPNIVRCIDLDREDDLHFIVMEWLNGKSLATILQESGSKKIDLATSMDIVRQVSLALEYAHQRGVIHGDVNPANIRITRDGEVKVFDFGIARVLQKEQDRQPDFDPRELGAKSPEYSSMQVLTGEDPVPADDVFSLGCLMYRLVAGHRVFGPRSAAEAASEGMEPQQAPGLPDKQWPALKKALAYSRVPRFKSPKEFVEALGEISTSAMMELPQPPKAPPKPDQSAIDTQTVPPIQQEQAAPEQKQPYNPVKLSQPLEVPQPPQAPQAAPPPQPEPLQATQPAQPVQTVPPPQAPQAAQPIQPAQAQHASQSMELPQPARSSRLVVPDEPLVARDFEIEQRRSPWGLIILAVILIGAGTAYFKPELLEPVVQLLPPELKDTVEEILAGATREPVGETIAEPEAETPVASAVAEQPLAEEPVAAGQTDGEPVASEQLVETPVATELISGEPVSEEPLTEEPVAEATETEDSVVDEPPAESVVEDTDAETVAEPEFDQTDLLPADLTVGLVATGQFVPEIEVTLREDAGAVTIDLVRMHNIREPLTVLLEEVGFSGNRSPWEEGQYVIANNGIATFEASQSRIRTRISMSTDTMREADRDVTIQVREIDNAEHEFARINLKLEDDDRRIYEASLPINTIAFGASEIFVSEADPAVQIEVVRFKPSSTPLEVSYRVNDLTTTAGEDYFPPGVPSIYFSPNQRSARILIPLVQDSDPEDSEVFALEFVNPARHVDPDIYQTIAIMIRDDD
jgi:serine/threonine protein kinase